MHHACQLLHIYPTLFPHCLRSVPGPIPFLGQKITPASPPTATAAHSYMPKMLHPQLTPFLRSQERSQAVPLSALCAINVLELCSHRCIGSVFFFLLLFLICFSGFRLLLCRQMCSPETHQCSIRHNSRGSVSQQHSVEPVLINAKDLTHSDY